MNKLVTALDIKGLNDAAGTFEGYASVYGNVDLAGDVVMPGAFSKTIQERTSVPLLWQHDPRTVIGKGSLEDRRDGLAIHGTLTSATQAGREALALLREGLLDGLSIGYSVVKGRFDRARGARLLTEIKLFEVSLVTFPANEAARIESVKRRVREADYEGLKRELRTFRRAIDAHDDATSLRMTKLELANFNRYIKEHNRASDLPALKAKMFRLLNAIQKEITTHR